MRLRGRLLMNHRRRTKGDQQRHRSGRQLLKTDTKEAAMKFQFTEIVVRVTMEFQFTKIVVRVTMKFQFTEIVDKRDIRRTLRWRRLTSAPRRGSGHEHEKRKSEAPRSGAGAIVNIQTITNRWEAYNPRTGDLRGCANEVMLAVK